MSKVKISGNASGTGVLTIEAPNTNTDRTISLPDSTGTLVDTTGATFTGGVTGTDVTLSGGLYVGGTGSANHLDDYEEGSGSTTVIMSTSGSVTSSGAYKYTKIGNVCHFQFEFNTSAISSPVGTLKVALPFTTFSGTYSAGALRVYNETFSGSPFIAAYPNENYVQFRTSRSGTTTGNITPTSGNRYYFGEITYRTA